MKTLNNPSNIIRYGEYHSFYPFRFDTDLEFNEICKRIENSDIIFTAKKAELVLDTLSSLNADLSEIYSSMEELKDIKITTTGHLADSSSVDLLEGDEYIRIEPLDTSIKIHLCSREFDHYSLLFDRYHREQNMCEELYSEAFSNSKAGYLLLPLRIKLSNDNFVWLNIRLYIFSNKMGILKLELPMIDMSDEILKHHKFDDYIDSIHNRWNIPGISSDMQYSDLGKALLLALRDCLQIHIIMYFNSLDNIILLDYDKLTSDFSCDTADNAFDLFSIVCAPMSEESRKYYEKRASEYVETHHWLCGNIKYVLKSTGGCLSTIDKRSLENAKAHEHSYFNNTDDDIYEKHALYSDIADEIRINTDFALMVLVLKKTIESSAYYEKTSETANLEKVRKSYNWDTIYLCELQDGIYGTVTEQISTFETKMPLYFKSALMDKKSAAIDELLKSEENKKREKTNNLLAKGGFLVAVFFALPAIHETLTILHDVFINKNIPLLTISNVSISIWVIIIAYVIIQLRKNKVD